MLELIAFFFIAGRFTVMLVPPRSWETKAAAWVKEKLS